MRVINNNETVQSEEKVTTPVVAAESYLGSFSYHEMADRPVVEVDALSQLHSNIEMLGDLQTRLSFVMREVRYLMKV